MNNFILCLILKFSLPSLLGSATIFLKYRYTQREGSCEKIRSRAVGCMVQPSAIYWNQSHTSNVKRATLKEKRDIPWSERIILQKKTHRSCISEVSHSPLVRMRARHHVHTHTQHIIRHSCLNCLRVYEKEMRTRKFFTLPAPRDAEELVPKYVLRPTWV